jgi:hypothetical protein
MHTLCDSYNERRKKTMTLKELNDRVSSLIQSHGPDAECLIELTTKLQFRSEQTAGVYVDCLIWNDMPLQAATSRSKLTEAAFSLYGIKTIKRQDASQEFSPSGWVVIPKSGD